MLPNLEPVINTQLWHFVLALTRLCTGFVVGKLGIALFLSLRSTDKQFQESKHHLTRRKIIKWDIWTDSKSLVIEEAILKSSFRTTGRRELCAHMNTHTRANSILYASSIAKVAEHWLSCFCWVSPCLLVHFVFFFVVFFSFFLPWQSSRSALGSIQPLIE